jgi:quercetin dioxygenase-like cupin family protein
MKMKIINLEDITRIARNLATKRIEKGQNADEFVEIGDADGFKLYVTAGETIKKASSSFHENPRDVFMMLLEGEMELIFEDGETTIVKNGQGFVLPKHIKHRCTFNKMTIALEGAYEKGL